MQALTMMGMTADDIAKIELLMKALSQTPGKLDELIERVEKLEAAVKNGE